MEEDTITVDPKTKKPYYLKNYALDVVYVQTDAHSKQ